MSLDRAIASGKERRRPFRRSQRFDKSCRNHGNCPWCMGNRLRRRRREESEARARLADWTGENPYRDKDGKPDREALAWPDLMEGE